MTKLRLLLPAVLLLPALLSAAGPLPATASGLRITGLYWTGQTIGKTGEKVTKTGYYQDPALLAKNPVNRLTDGRYGWRNSIATHFWGNQPKQIEVLFDLGAPMRLAKAEIWQGGVHQKGNLIEQIEVSGSMENPDKNQWDTPVEVSQQSLGKPVRDSAYPVMVPLAGTYRYLRLRCKSRRSAMMILSEVRFYGEPAGEKAVQSGEPPAAVRFETENIPGTFKLKKKELLEGNGCFITRAHSFNLKLPQALQNRKLYSHIRYLDNGSKTLEFALHGQAMELPATGGKWSWHRGPVFTSGTAPLSGSLRRKGKENGLTDSIILTPDPEFNPARNDSPMFLKKIPRTTLAPSFAARLLKQNPKISPMEFARRVALHHQITPAQQVPVIDRYNNLLFNGKPFFQLGFYHVQPGDPRLGNLPLNTFISSDDEARLQPGQAVVISHLASLRAYDELAERLKKFRRNKIIMHYLSDEPDGHIDTTVRDLELLNALVKTICPDNVTFINFAANSTMHQAFTITDAIGLDHYPIPSGRIADIAYTMDAMRYFSGNRPVVFVPQTFSWKGYGIADGRYPTPDEFNAMTMLSLVHCAKGLLFYEFPAPKLSSKTCIADLNPVLWKHIHTVIDSIRRIQDGLLGPDLILPAEIQVQDSQRSPEFRIIASADRTRGWLLAVNPWPESIRCTLDFSAGCLKNLSLHSEFNSGITISNASGKGVFSLDFKPYSTMCCRTENAPLAQLQERTTKQLLAELEPVFKPAPGFANLTLPARGGSIDLLDSWQSLKRPDEARLSADAEGLHIRAVLRFPAGSESVCKTRDGRVWNDPAVEVFLGMPSRSDYVHLMVNTLNVQADWIFNPALKENVNKTADFQWQSQADFNGERAVFDITIPWDTLRRMTGARPGDIMTFNLASSLGMLDWIGLTGSGYHAPARFGRIKLK